MARSTVHHDIDQTLFCRTIALMFSIPMGIIDSGGQQTVTNVIIYCFLFVIYRFSICKSRKNNNTHQTFSINNYRITIYLT